MKGEEKNALFFQKKREGKSNELAYDEVQRDIEFLKLQKIKKKNLQAQIIILEDKKRKLNESFKEKFKKLQEKEERLKKKNIPVKRKLVVEELVDLPKRTKGIFASVAHLNRVLIYIRSQDQLIKQNKIQKDCLLTLSQTRSALLFLTKHKLIKKKGDKYAC